LFDLSIYEQGPNLPNPVDGSGKFTAEVTDFKGRYVKEADKDIIAAVKVGILFVLTLGQISM
jgi:isoleucyl-tRNA synthetase